MRCFLFFIAFAFFISCTSSESKTSHSFTIYEEDGVVIAESSSEPKYVGPIFNYEEVLRLNQDESNIESLLSLPFTFLMDEEGAFYIWDSRPDRILCFNASGKYAYNIGRQGDGPGEYRSSKLEYVQNGILVVNDTRLNRISRFRTDGTFIDATPLPSTDMVVQRFRFGPNDEQILLGDYQRGFRNEYRYNTAVSFVFTATGDTLTSIVSDSVKTSYFFRLDEYRMSGSAQVYFSPWPQVLYHPAHGLILSTGLEPIFRCYGLDGQLNRMIHLDILPDPVTNTDRDTVRSYLKNRIQEAEDDRTRTLRQKTMEFHEFQDPKAYWISASVDEYGYLWASRPNLILGSEASEWSSPTILVFSPQGEYLGDTCLPARRARVSKDHVLSIEEDSETGEYHLIVYRIIPAVEGLKYP